MRRIFDVLVLFLFIATRQASGCKSQTTSTLAPTSTAATRGPNRWPQPRVDTTAAAAASSRTTPAAECRCGVVSAAGATRAVSGTNVFKNEFPWQVALIFYGKTKPFCSGTLISSRTVLTAAHCYTNTSLFKVVVNEYNLAVDDGQFSVTPASFVKHPSFNSSSLDYDLALVTLASEVTLTSTMLPVCLPDQPDQDSRVSTVTGWGTMYADGQQSSILQKVDVMTMNNSACVLQTGGLYAEADLSPRMVCGQATGRASCVEDSGSPLLAKNWQNGRYEQTGVFSWGAGCKQAGAPSVYSRVYSLNKWIQDNMIGRTCPP